MKNKIIVSWLVVLNVLFITHFIIAKNEKNKIKTLITNQKNLIIGEFTRLIDDNQVQVAGRQAHESRKFPADFGSKSLWTENYTVGITSTAPHKDALTLQNINDGPQGPILTFYHHTLAPKEGNILGDTYYVGRNDKNEIKYFGRVYCRQKKISDGSEAGSITWGVLNKGDLSNAMRLDNKKVLNVKGGIRIGDFEHEAGSANYLISASPRGNGSAPLYIGNRVIMTYPKGLQIYYDLLVKVRGNIKKWVRETKRWIKKD